MIGTRLGPYEITAAIGAGGMGEVYRGRDATLNRDVAIKVLPAAMAADPERLARFKREAQVLASLNHPNIAHVHGFEAATLADGSTAHFLAMEMVEGEDLAERLKRGAIPVDEAIAIAKQIAEALEEAHERGIIHRDLKPANVKVTPDGKVKILDFGLAKALEKDPGVSALNPQLSHSPTMSRHMTEAGMIMGTAAYMSPEQARGKPVDKRADIWSFGVVLLEMLIGRRVFRGDDVSETLAAVIRDAPPLGAVPRETPEPLRRLLRRCLEKDPRRRLDSASAARLEIEDALASPGESNAVSVALSKGATRLPWALATTLGVALIAALVGWSRRSVEAPESRVDIVTPGTTELTSFALSPDGRQMVFVARGEGGTLRLWLRSLASATAQPLPGTEGATFPFWSPDGRSLAFFSPEGLKRFDLGGGAPQLLAPASNARGGTWNQDGVILWSQSPGRPLVRISAKGGDVTEATRMEAGQTSHRFPWFLPDGRRFLYYSSTAEDWSIYLGSLDGASSRRLISSDSAGVYLDTGWLLWERGGSLVAQRLDIERGVLSGEPVTVSAGVAVDRFYKTGVSVAANGLLAYRTAETGVRQLTWFDRSGAPRGTAGAPDEDNLADPRLSPDGRRVALTRQVQTNTDIWLLDGARLSRFTFNTGTDRDPVWSPDGSRIAFDSTRSGVLDLFLKPATGAGEDEQVTNFRGAKFPNSWSPDGRFLMYDSTDPQDRGGLWILPMDGDRKPLSFLQTPFDERWGIFSPDGRFVAYMSDESGRMEIYVRPFSPPDEKGALTTAVSAQWQISTEGGSFPVWRPDGKELFYLSPAGDMMAAAVTVRGRDIDAAAPVRLFRTRIAGGGSAIRQGRQYDVSKEGRFLINTVLDDTTAPITLILNWRPGKP